MQTLLYAVRTVGLEAQRITFMVEAEDAVVAVMKAQENLDKLNAALRVKFPELCDCEAFAIDGVERTQCVTFNEVWMKEFVETVTYDEVEDD